MARLNPYGAKLTVQFFHLQLLLYTFKIDDDTVALKVRDLQVLFLILSEFDRINQLLQYSP